MWAEVMKNSIKERHVNLSAEIGRANITFGDMMSFEVGNVIALNKSVSDEVVLMVEEVPKFKGLPGTSRGNQAIKLTGVIE